MLIITIITIKAAPARGLWPCFGEALQGLCGLVQMVAGSGDGADFGEQPAQAVAGHSKLRRPRKKETSGHRRGRHLRADARVFPEAGHRFSVSRGASQQCLVLGFVSACRLVGTTGAESTSSVAAARGALCRGGAWSGGGPGWAALCRGQELRISVVAASGAPCGGGTWSGGGPRWAALR